MPDGSSPLAKLFALEEIGADRFRGYGPKTHWQRVYGGLVISQALAAVTRTVGEDRSVHSLHAYFILPGDPAAPILFEVDRLRDGRSFTTRYCRAIQHGQTIFALTASYHCEEQGLEHFTAMPDVAQPEDLLNFAELQQRFQPERSRTMFEYFAGEAPLEFKPVNPGRYFGGADRRAPSAAQNIWFRAVKSLSNDRSLHQCVLAYASDMTLLDATTAAHSRSVTDGSLQPASLDHAIWFHRDFRVDDWVLFVQESPNAGRARGLATGRLYSRDGSLIASVAQEGLIRLRRPAAER